MDAPVGKWDRSASGAKHEWHRHASAEMLN